MRHLCDRAHNPSGIVTPRPANKPVAAQASIAAGQPRRVLVTWYGSFDGHGTIGDWLAMQSVTSHLVGRGHRVYHASTDSVQVSGTQQVDWLVVSPGQFDVLIFVCGPILKEHPQTQLLFERFQTCRKIGVGVSLFPSGHSNYFDPFDHVLAREGRPERFEDVAIVAPAIVPYPLRTVSDRGVTVGVVLRGQQIEYGIERCLWEKTAALVDEVTDSIVSETGGRVVKIENHLRRSGLTPSQIEAQYGACDLVISSRFHGAILAARHGVPFIAIDQISGGAKVSALLGGAGWPSVFQVDSVDKQQVLQGAHQLLAGDGGPALLQARDRAIHRANLTLAALDELLER